MTIDLKDRLVGRKVSAFMTAPRYESTWARNMIEAALKEAGIPLVVSQGVFYGQCMQRMLTDAVEAGVEIAITVDFDSIFTADDVRYLLNVINDERYDAVAALQSRRGMAYPLFTRGDETQVEFNGEPIEVATAHFGLTAIKLEKLRDVPKPWFCSTPDEWGEWTDGKVDDDIHFWRQWKGAGNKVFVDAALSIGHMEEMVARFDEKGKHEFIYPNEWFEENIMPSVPKEVVQEQAS
jgi:hypothetical protein